MDLFDLSAKITLDSKDYEDGLKNAASSAEGFGSKLGSAMKVGLAAVTAVTAAVTALTGAIVSAVGKTAEYGDTIDKQSQKLGMSAQAYQEWDAILQHSGTSIDAMSRGMVTLSKQAESNSAAFQRLGITQEEIASMNQEELFARTIEGLQGMEAGTERTALAQELLGGSAKELGALLNTSAEDTEAMRQRVHDLGGVMSDDAVKAAAAYQDSLQDMKTALSGASRGMLSEFLPSVTLVMDGLTELFSGGNGIAKITEGINQFIANLNATIPKVIQTGSQILQSLAQAIIANLPTLVESAVPIITELANGIIENLPMLLESALQIIVTLALGIADAIPELLPTITEVVLQITQMLIDNVDLLIDASLQIIIAIAEGLIASLPVLLAKAPQIIASLVTAIIGAVGQLLSAAGSIISTLAQGIASGFGRLVQKGREILTKVKDGVMSGISSLANVGKNIVEGIWNGISNGLTWIKNKLKEWVGNVTDFLKNLLGISSPSKVMRDEVGKYMAQGIGVGFENEMKSVEKSMQDSMPDLRGNYDFSINGSAGGYYNSGIANSAHGLAIYGDISISIDGAGKDAEEIGRELYQMLNRKVGAYAY